MKAAANVVAILAWGGVLAAMWLPVLTGEMPPFGFWLAAMVVSFLIGLVAPPFLLNLEERMQPRPGQRRDG